VMVLVIESTSDGTIRERPPIGPKRGASVTFSIKDADAPEQIGLAIPPSGRCGLIGICFE
jgi:hypothetical protein